MAELMATPGAAPTCGTPFDELALRERVEGDTEFLREIIALFLEDNPRLMADIRAAVAAGNALALKRAAHTLRGAAANFGAAAVVAGAKELETLANSGNLRDAASAADRLAAVLGELETALRVLACQQ